MRKTKEEALKTRENILNAATDLFSSKGVQATSLVEIADAANVTRGAIYWHFKNKLEIFEALHTHLHQNFIETIVKDLETDHPEPLKQMRNICTHLLVNLANDETKRKALTLFLLKCNYVGELENFDKLHKQHKAEALQLLKQYLQRAKKKGVLNADADIDVLIISIDCYIKGILFEYLGNVDSFDIKTKAPQLMDLYFSRLA